MSTKRINKSRIKSMCMVSFLILSFMCFHTSIHAQSKVSERLVGEWSMDLKATKAKMSKDKKDLLKESDSRAFNTRIESKYGNRILLFNKDGSFSMVVNGDEKVAGNWELSEDDQKIIIVEEVGRRHAFQINSLTPNRLQIKPIVKNDADLLFAEWYLAKK